MSFPGTPEWVLRESPVAVPTAMLAAVAVEYGFVAAGNAGLVSAPVSLIGAVATFLMITVEAVRFLQKRGLGPARLRLRSDRLELSGVPGSSEWRIRYSEIYSIEVRAQLKRVLIGVRDRNSLSIPLAWFESSGHAEEFIESLRERVEESPSASRAQADRIRVGLRVLAGVSPLSLGVAITLCGLFTVQLMVDAFSIDALVSLGAAHGGHVGQGEWIRLLTGALLHAGPRHIIVNTLSLLFLGSLLERVLGWARFGLILGASSVLALVAWSVTIPGPAVGFSGATFGATGAWFALRILRGEELPAVLRLPLAQLGLLAFWLIAASLSIDEVAFRAHLAGFVSGFVLLPLVCPGGALERLPRETPRWLRLAAVLLGVAYLAGAVSIVVAAVRL